jgi:16S rRNA processing protein RimM
MTSPGDQGERKIALAMVAGAHGIKGELRLKLFSTSCDSIAVHNNLYVGGAARRLLFVRDSGKTAVARFEGISDRSSAEALRGALIEIERSALPPLAEDEYYHADLIGLDAVDRDGNSVGSVVAVENYGAGDLLEIEAQDGRSWLIPFKPGIAELAGERIILDREFLA